LAKRRYNGIGLGNNQKIAACDKGISHAGTENSFASQTGAVVF
jgi:hypothetical protein